MYSSKSVLKYKYYQTIDKIDMFKFLLALDAHTSLIT